MVWGCYMVATKKVLKVYPVNKNIVHSFWKDYEDCDILERSKKIEFIVKMLNDIITIDDEKLRSHAINNLLTSYFDDLLEYKNVDDDK
ncbi:MAG: hypothetical protein Q7R52_02410 [archaeon]|nr:hypothetical protein [archaeon]